MRRQEANNFWLYDEPFTTIGRLIQRRPPGSSSAPAPAGRCSGRFGDVLGVQPNPPRISYTFMYAFPARILVPSTVPDRLSIRTA